MYTRYLANIRHHPDSPEIALGEKKIVDLRYLKSRPIVILEKYDGENILLTKQGFLAKKQRFFFEESKEHIKVLWNEIRSAIPDGWKLYGKSMMFQHSIQYKKEIPPFILYAVWNEKDFCLDWDDLTFFLEEDLLDFSDKVVLPEELYSGTWYARLEPKHFFNIADMGKREGLIIRSKGQFHLDHLDKYVIKYMITPKDRTWMYKPLVMNKIREGYVIQQT